MFRIHNRRLFWRLAGRSIKANLGRNLLTALAVFLSTLMLFSIFTIGVNYFRNLQVMMDRLDGVTDALLYAPTQEQYEQIKATPGDYSRCAWLRDSLTALVLRRGSLGIPDPPHDLRCGGNLSSGYAEDHDVHGYPQTARH